MYVIHKIPVRFKFSFTSTSLFLLIVSRTSGLKAPSAEAQGRAARTATTQKQAMRKSHPPTGFELSVPGSPVHRSTTRAREDVTPHA